MFWAGTLGLVVFATLFMLSGVVTMHSQCAVSLSIKQRFIYVASCAFFLLTFSYCMYARYGDSDILRDYYSPTKVQLRHDYTQVRPLYARLQRELVKDSLNLPLDTNNIQLILHFAQSHANAQNGILQPEVQSLLSSVLKAVPRQITALNLLAVHAYKTADYAQAVAHWQAILQQFTPEMRKTEHFKVLQSKITETSKLAP